MTTERVMLLIDADNVSVDVMEQAVRLLMNQHGAVHVRRAYCTAEGAVKHQAAFKRLSIKPMVNLSAGKNSTDIALAVDAIDLVLAERPDVVVIASSDSDFAPLVARLREKGCVVRGIGQEGKTGEETQDAYDDFTVLAHRKLPGAAATSAASTGAPRRGGGRTTGGGRAAAAPRKGQKDQQLPNETAGDDVPVRPTASGEAARGQPAGRGRASGGGERGGRAERGQREDHAERPSQRGGGRSAPARSLPSAADLAEDEAAAEATLAALREATDRAALQQAEATARAAAVPQAPEATRPPAEPDGDDGDGAALGTAPAATAKKSARKGATGKTASRKTAAAKGGTAAKPARKAPARKAAAKRGTVVPTDANSDLPASLPTHRPESQEAARAVADAEALAAQIAATLAPPVAPAPSAAPGPTAQQRPAQPKPSSPAVAALPDKVLKILASLPELARGDTVELRLASQRMRDAGLLGQSASSTKLLGQFADRFELLPPGQPNHVRLRGGKLF